jgi:hypothetical protein
MQNIKFAGTVQEMRDYMRGRVIMEHERIKRRLSYIRDAIVNERVSYSEVSELISLAQYIDDDDVLLLQWAGVEEK